MLKNIFGHKNKPCKPPKREIENPYKYYPGSYSQDARKSIVALNGKYDMLHLSAHEESIVKKVILTTKRKYPKKYMAIGMSNETSVIVYKPRYILYELIIIAFQNSESPLDMIAVSLAYESKGAQYRQEALRYYEKAKNQVNLMELNEFASVSILSSMSKIASAYEKEHEYKKAIECLRVIIKSKEGNTQYFRNKITELKGKEEKPLRRRKMTNEQAEFENNVHIAALKYVSLL